VSKKQPEDEREMILTVKNTFFYLAPPSPSASPLSQGRAQTAPGVGAPQDDGDSGCAQWLEGKSSDGSTPTSGTPERQGGSDDEPVPDEIELRVTIKNTFIVLEPVVSELSLRTGSARRHRTAPEVLLAAALARDSPRSGNEGCAEGIRGGYSESTTVPSSRGSRSNSRELDDVVSRCPSFGERSKALEMKYKPGHWRPGKNVRNRYKAVVTELLGMVRQDPSFSLESFPVPQIILNNAMLKAKLVAHVEAARLVAC
jgi:hypothetical protein